MRRSINGFTVIELIVIIVVIGILATIAIVSYTGIQKAALNEQRSSELLGWRTSFEKYKAANGQYPVMANGGYCLGTGFPEGRCRNYTSTTTNVYYESNSTALMQALAPFDPPPAGTRVPVVNIAIGPYAIYSSTTIQLYASLTGVNESDCPEGSTKTFQDSPANTRMNCAFTLTR
jgi:Tfp pilus assembly protein PilE